MTAALPDAAARAAQDPPNGAEVLVRTLLANQVDVCFANPGTSEMHFVAALDRIEGMRCVLGLFEGVVTGAADGYARMADKPAATLLHLAPGLGNGLANLHNAKRAQVPMVNIVGEHRQGHKATDSALTGDIEGIARTMCDWVHTCSSADHIAQDAAAAVQRANSRPGRIATLVLPADTAWTQTRNRQPVVLAPEPPTLPSDQRFDAALKALRSGENTILLLSGRALRAGALEDASRIAQRSGARLLAQYANGRIERGRGRVVIERTPAPVDQGVAAFRDARHVILVGAKVPAPMFGYPGKPDYLMDPAATLIELTQPSDDLPAVLKELAARLGAADAAPLLQPEAPLPLPDGALTPDAVLQAVSALMPQQAIVVDESVTAGRAFFPISRASAPHDYLQLTGGAIGDGIPMAVGAAVACPGRKVINLEGDGSSMYTIQGLWTQARERLDVLTIVFANKGYKILKGEMANVGAGTWGARAEQMLSIVNPEISWVKLAQGMGVEAAQATTTQELLRLLRHGLAMQGPFLIEVQLA
ncbi:acetolactate synthase large subunit [Xylophilus rhododendri]|uniref:Acetolactate synthase large subunit n=1 Tax=Xylophilus rhododendri TaxID=2697032 RepID=A0A857J6B7_9BURK|nr:acetolactate synthase large subunit [Xylophilus rhododendri]QHI99267.1 acetolactate synthase large subunit [Xylophilus rhododendri]